jgi:hypothetical protein
MKTEKELIKMYMAAAAEVIGERTSAEAAFDDAVVAAMNDGLSLQDALTRAGKEHPKEALTVTDADIPDLGARYEYLREHARLMGVVK